MPEEVRLQYEAAVTKPLDTVLRPEQTFHAAGLSSRLSPLLLPLLRGENAATWGTTAASQRPGRPNREQRAVIIGEWLQTKARYLA
jgi:hypothetical protein